MPTTVNTPLRSDYGFKSPSFTVDANGNISATTLTLSVNSDEAGVAADYDFVESAGNFRFDGESNNQPTLTVYRNQTTTIDLAFTTLVFKIFSSVAVGNTVVYSSGLRHSDSTVGVSAQGKNTGRLTWTIPLGAPDTLYYGNVDGTVYGIINVLDQTRNFSEVSITNTTQSTSPTTGALKVTGGLGVVRNANFGGTLSVASMITATGGVTGDLNGSVYSDSSTLLVDSVNGRIVGPINNSTIDNTSIGATTPSTAAFTTATLSGAVTGVTAVPNKKYVDETATAFAIAFGI
jgi:hypothetical protein|tara:strand:- start:29 stop:901 length:873 start_codon:yes stop_codon:yes gene_type:complete